MRNSGIAEMGEVAEIVVTMLYLYSLIWYKKYTYMVSVMALHPNCITLSVDVVYIHMHYNTCMLSSIQCVQINTYYI